MKKTKRMLRPYELWDPGVVEQWLEEEAAAGWRLTDWSGWRVKFEAAEPKECRVRVYPQSEPESREAFWERIAAYEEMGWNFAAAIGLEFEVFYCDDPAVPELFTDPETYALAWEKQLDGARAMAWVTLAMTVFMTLMVTTGVCVKEGSFLKGMLDMSGFFWLLLLLVLPVLVVLSARQLGLVRRLRRQIRAGVEPAADPNWRKRRRWWKVMVVLYALYWFLFCFRDVYERRFFEPDTDGLPYVTTSELAPETNEEDWEVMITSFEDIAYYGTFLRPTRYELQFTNEEYMVRNESHRLRFEFLAKALYQERYDDIVDEWPGAEQISINDEAFDEAVVLKNDGAQVLLTRAGTIVYALHTNLPLELEEQIDHVKEDLKS